MIVLTSNGLSHSGIIEMILKKSSLKPQKACVIVTSVVPEKSSAPWVISVCNDLRAKGFEEIKTFDFEYEKPEMLKYFDLLYFMGGNPFNLLKHAKTTEVQEILSQFHLEDKIILGRSASSMVLSSGAKYVEEFNDIMNFGPEHRNTMNAHDLSGFLFSSFILFPHYDKAINKNENLEKKICEIETRENIKIVRMRDGEAFFIDSGGTTTFLNTENEVKIIAT